MRGTRGLAFIAAFRARIIPARAGNTVRTILVTTSTSDHPRACGEHTHPTNPCFDGFGSSPRVRGTLLHDRRFCRGRRIIPARAGNTVASPASWRPLPDHPRACGEHVGAQVAVELHDGSSPRVRGTLIHDALGRQSRRIIPARAGNTLAIRSFCRRATDHPRACGEHVTPDPTAAPIYGSSPRVRGTHDARAAPRRRARIIPARAGNTRR